MGPCAILRCPQTAVTVYELKDPAGDLEQEVLVCGEHLQRLEAGEDWAVSEPVEPTMKTGILMGDDLSPKVLHFKVTSRAGSRSGLLWLELTTGSSGEEPRTQEFLIEDETARSLAEMLKLLSRG